MLTHRGGTSRLERIGTTHLSIFPIISAIRRRYVDGVLIAQNAFGFIYIVSSMGVTRVRREITTDISTIGLAFRSATKVPLALAFTPAHATKVAETADGVIVGSAIVKIIAEYEENAGSMIYQYVKDLIVFIMEKKLLTENISRGTMAIG